MYFYKGAIILFFLNLKTGMHIHMKCIKTGLKTLFSLMNQKEFYYTAKQFEIFPHCYIVFIHNALNILHNL